MSDGLSESFRVSLLSSITDLCDVNVVAEKFDEYISQACEITFDRVSCKHKRKTKAPKWYDAECRAKRALAIKAGERVTTHADKQKQTAACRAYRSRKPRKEREYIKTCVHEIQSAFFNNRGNLWRVRDNASNNKGCAINTEQVILRFY